jgi:pimeloyl-ACP methyl ester carboxylesterase
MQHVTSADGVQIAFERSGTGPPLILVHGGLASDHSRWNPLVEHIDDCFTVYAMDRRGRGGSGDNDAYSFEIEVEDVVALANSIESPISMYGVSSGANYSLEAALRIGNLRRLVLYEPAILPATAESSPEDVTDKVQKLLDEGNSEEALVTIMREVVRMPPQEIEHMRQTPTWLARVAAAHTVSREEQTLEDYRFDPDRFRGMQTPTMLLKGSESPQFLKDSVDIVHSALPDSRIHLLHGQGHLADIMAPDMVAEVLKEFLLPE